MKIVLFFLFFFGAGNAGAIIPAFPSKSLHYVNDEPLFDLKSDKDCLIAAMVNEVVHDAGEKKHAKKTIKSMENVGRVVLSRKNHELYPGDVCKVVYQRKQFSFLISDVQNLIMTKQTIDKKRYQNWDADWNKVDFKKLHKIVMQKSKWNKLAYKRAEYIANLLLEEDSIYPIQEATNYYAKFLDRQKLAPEWSKKLTLLYQDGQHKFFN